MQLRYYLLLFVLLIFPLAADGQVNNDYNINKYNGLRSDHVYYTIKDSYGYLWLATTQGVVRYNGYSFKTFDLSDGLPNNDVWYLFEDWKKRIWLSSLSSEFGYIHNSRYTKTYIRDTDARIFPAYIANTDSGIIFCNYSRKSEVNSELYIERNDTLNNYSAPALPNATFMLNAGKKIFVADHSEYFKAKFNSGHIDVATLCKKDTGLHEEHGNTTFYLFNDYVISYTVPILSSPDLYNKEIFVQNLKTCATSVLPLVKNSKEKINMVDGRNNKLYIITDKNIYTYDSSLHLLEIIANKQFINDENASHSIISLLDDSFWGKCIATTNHGLFLDLKSQNKIGKSSLPLTDYVYVGASADSCNFWWRKSDDRLAILDKNNHIIYKVYHDFSALKMIPFDAERTLLLANDNVFWFNNKSKNVSSFFDPGKGISLRNSITAVWVNDYFYFLFHDAIFKFDPSKKTATITTIDKYKYNDLIYDAAHTMLWAYNSNKIFLYNISTGNTCTIKKNLLNAAGITKIEKLFIDERHGNIFIKDFRHFFVFNYNTFKYRELFRNYSMKDVSFRLNGDVITAAGAFGVFFSKINGPLSVTQPFVFTNPKNILYKYISDIQVTQNEVLLNTEHGLYQISIPNTFQLQKTRADRISPNYKLILSYQDSIFSLSGNDTINVRQYATTLDFDIINPSGVGTPKYVYRLDGLDSTWHELVSDELHLPRLVPGVYYPLSLKVYDDVWQSRPVNCFLYVQPYWWQTSYAKKTIWLCAIALLLLAIVIASFLTRRIVTRNNEKKGLRQALELKAIYSQLNPHFIFNSLNLTLYLISKNKLEDAYTHVSKFSRLLRAYLKSFRNRYISVAEECTNIGNYIELQQMRFDNIFSYEIITDPTLDTETTMIPALLLQPLVENAINHGLLPKGKDGFLQIEFVAHQQTNTLICIVEDNGVGRHAAARQQNESLKKDSYGTSLTSELINIFNRYEHTGIRLSYVDKELPLTGTIVKIEIQNPRYHD